MVRKGHSPEQILAKVRQVEVAVANGKTIALAAREAGISDQTYHRWRREYGGVGIDQVKRMKLLEQERGSTQWRFTPGSNERSLS